ncbi:MAG: DUF2088 domain-containing protein [Pirellulales bacterium]|nr:DUF2088 domain-containing protein [Pirellulales bacterium]
MAVMQYGTGSSVRLELAEGALPVECGFPRGAPIEDPAAALAEVLAAPLDYPPLARSTTPGDRVVLALGHGLPQADRIAAVVIQSLVAAGVAADGITVLRTQEDAGEGRGDPRRLLDGEVQPRITLATHQPKDRNELAYLAASSAGEPILLSRAIHDADLVLPIGCLHDRSAAGYWGIHGTIFPALSDQRTLRRYRSLGALDTAGDYRKALVHDVEQVAWLLGITFTIQLVPGAGGSVLHVLAGQSDAVARRGHELFRAAWGSSVPEEAELVVAAVEGDAGEQTWENFGRALEVATALVEEDGAIAVCCELAAEPGPAVQQMMGARSRDAALRRIRKKKPPDALVAAQLARALDRGKVYLLSRLEASQVEELDMIHVAAPDELTRLARRHRSCVALSNAQRAMVTTEQLPLSQDLY